MHRLELKGIIKAYKAGKSSETTALRGVDFYADENESIAIMGVSGSGKSTLLNIIGCMDFATCGQCFYNGRDIQLMNDVERAALRRTVFGFIPQSYDLILTDNVYQNIALPMVLAGKKNAHIKSRVKELAKAVGLADKLKRKARELSGGEMQRVAIARAIANDPEIILADEPTAALDIDTAKSVMGLLRSLCVDGGRTLLFVSHDSRMTEFADRVVELKDGVLK